MTPLNLPVDQKRINRVNYLLNNILFKSTSYTNKVKKKSIQLQLRKATIYNLVDYTLEVVFKILLQYSQ